MNKGETLQNQRELRLMLGKFYTQLHKYFNDAVASKLLDSRSKCSVFYTNPFKTLKKGNIYFLGGINPGGEAKEGKNFPLENLSYWNSKSFNYCAYCESWGNRPKGEHPLQKRVKEVFAGLKYDLKNILCLNMFFFRTPNTAQLQKIQKKWKEWDNYRKFCWEYHEQFLKIVKPKLIICNGNGKYNSAFSEFKKHFNPPKMDDYKIYNGKTLYLRWFSLDVSEWGEEKVFVIGIPHMSRFKPTKEMLQKLKELKVKAINRQKRR